jgi:hypothetical protein
MNKKLTTPQKPGEIYRSISIDSRDFTKDTDKLFQKKTHPYVSFSKKISKKFPGLGKNAKYNNNFEKAIDFLNWDLSSEEYSAATKFVVLINILIAIFLIFASNVFLSGTFAKLFGNEYMSFVLCFGIPTIMALYTIITFKNYPLSKVEDEKIKALTFVPEIIGYLIMSMKLVPNLERAIEFAAEHGHGKIAEDLKKLLWEVKVGIKNSVAEAVDELAYKWGDVSAEMKKGLMKIRACVIETSDAKRYQLLDQTMADTLSSIKTKLEDYARTLTQPTMIMFYLGVLLPLLLIIVLPVGSAFSGSTLARGVYLVMIYNIALPITTIIFARTVIKKRPPTYVPPKIPNNHPDLPPKNTLKIGKVNINVFIVIIIIVVVGTFTSIYLQQNFGKTRENVLIAAGLDPINPEFRDQDHEASFWSTPENNITPHYVIFGVLLMITMSLSLWCYTTSIYKRRIQLRTEKMEGEFKDALYIIASRLGENKPIEDALDHTRNFLPRSLIAQSVFGKTIDNIKILGLNLQSALFDKNYGALKNNPSTIINGAMQLLVDSVQLGVGVAAKTLMSYSLQLRNTDEVNKMLSTLIKEITSTLSSMAKFIAPIILGITTALQKIVVSTLISIAQSGTLQEMEETMSTISTAGVGMEGVNVGGAISGMAAIDTEVIATIASPTTFTIIVAIYVIQIVLIMTYFTTMIEQDNLTLVKLRIAQTLPVSIILFIVTMILSNMMF